VPQEGVDLLRRRRQADQVEGDPAEQPLARRRRGGTQAGALQPGGDEVVGGVTDPGGGPDGGHPGADRRPPGPMRPPPAARAPPPRPPAPPAGPPVTATATATPAFHVRRLIRSLRDGTYQFVTPAGVGQGPIANGSNGRRGAPLLARSPHPLYNRLQSAR